MYHGTDHEIFKFSDEFVGGNNAVDQEGPGIYFTSSFEEANIYGKNIYKVTIKPRKLTDITNKRVVSVATISNLIKISPSTNVNNEDSLSNWDINPVIALRKAVTSLIDYAENEKDLFQQIWFDFYRNYPIEFVRNMVKFGYDGQLIKNKYNTINIILYNPNSIISVEKLDNKLIDEGVADIYGSKQFGLPNDNNNFENKFNSNLLKKDNTPTGQIYAKKELNDKTQSIIYVYKNPKSLNNFGNNVRAIADSKGNIYVAEFDGNFNHGQIAQSVGIVRDSFLLYSTKMLDNVVLLHRVGSTYSFGLSDASTDAFKYNKEKIINILNKTKEKNPEYNFNYEYYKNATYYNEENVNNTKNMMDESLQSDLKAFRAEKELQNQLKPTILPRDIKGNYIMKDINYTAIVINDRSKSKLIERFKNKIPEGYTIIKDDMYMFICNGRLPENQLNDVGLTTQLTVETFAMDDKIIAVGVTGYYSENIHPHVTIAINESNNSIDISSNHLKNWEDNLRFKISGIITEIPYTIK
jgi:hypothetical protein